jgi:hypothetical protein
MSSDEFYRRFDYLQLLENTGWEGLAEPACGVGQKVPARRDRLDFLPLILIRGTPCAPTGAPKKTTMTDTATGVFPDCFALPDLRAFS